MEYPVQWDIIVDMLVLILGLVQNYGWHESFTIRSGKEKLRATEWCLFYSLHFPHSFTSK